MAGTVLAWVNACKTAVLSATSAEPLLPVSNLAGDQGSTASGWQTLAGVTTATVTITPAARTTFRAAGVFRTNMTSAGGMAVNFYTNPGPVLVGTIARTAMIYGQAVGVLAADTAADYCQIVLDDAANPDGHLNIPLAFAGPAWLPLSAMSFASTMGRDALADSVQTRGGQTYVNLRASARRWEIALEGVRVSEAFSQLDVLDRACRSGSNVLAIPDRTSTLLQNEATYGILTPTADVAFPFGAGDRRSWRARLIERL